MRWLLHAALGPVVAVTAAGADEPAPVHEAPPPIAVDGVLDVPAWKQAQVVEADYVWGQVGQRGAHPQLRVRYNRDDHCLSVGYETFDENLESLGTGEKDGPQPCDGGGPEAEGRREGFEAQRPERHRYGLHGRVAPGLAGAGSAAGSRDLGVRAGGRFPIAAVPKARAVENGRPGDPHPGRGSEW